MDEADFQLRSDLYNYYVKEGDFTEAATALVHCQARHAATPCHATPRHATPRHAISHHTTLGGREPRRVVEGAVGRGEG